MNRWLTSWRTQFVRLLAGGAALGLALAWTIPTWGANPLFLGNLSLLVDEGVVQQLKLSTQQRQQVEQLIRRRDSAALEFAISARQLSTDERRQQLAEFVAASERMAGQLLNPTQQQQLKKIQLGREGLATLAQSEVAEQLQLSADQQQQIQRVLAEREREMEQVDEAEQGVVRAVYERKLQQLLTPDQQARWEQISGRRVAASAPVALADRAVSSADQADGPTAVLDGQPPGAANDPASSGVVSDGATVDGLLYFNFRYAPWKDVLEWFAEQADLSLVLDAPPPGTFNYSDTKGFSPSASIDLLNSVLLTKGYVLVRRQRMLLVINLEDGIPPNLVTTVSVEELDRRGEFELVKCLFPLGTSDPETVEQEISKLIGPQGRVEILPQARQLVVTETAGRLRTIRDVLRAMEDPAANGTPQVRVVPLEHISPDEAFSVIRQMLGLPEELNALADGSLRMATDPSGQRIMVTGQPDSVSRVTEVLQLIDVPASGTIQSTPQLEVYSVPDADSESALEVLQTLLGEEPDVRLATDPQTGHLVALALPSHHATIRATLEQLQRDAQQVEVLRLRYVDPQVAVLSINTLFGGGEQGSGRAPKVDADVTTGQLLLRGTPAQVAQIRTLLEKMGETNTDADLMADHQRRLRVVPLTGLQAESVLQQVQEIWPTLRANRIRTVTPSAAARAVQPRRIRPPEDRPPEDPARTDPPPTEPPPTRPAPTGRAPTDEATENNGPPKTGTAAGAGQFAGSILALAIEPPRVAPSADNQSGASSSSVPPSGSDSLSPPAAQKSADAEPLTVGSDIVVAPGPGGLLIASQDLDALNDFEDLLMTLANRQGSAARQFAVFYLRYATAEATAELLTQVLGGDGGAASDGGGGGGLLGSLAGAALGDAGGGLVGSLLGLGGGSLSLTASGSFLIVPEPRLNFLIVQASPTDMQLIEQLLEMIDQRQGPEEVETIAAPRLIPVLHTSAEAVADVVRQVYANRLASGPGQTRQPTPEEFLRALRGGGGGRGGDSSARIREQQQMTVGIDTRSNSLVIGAPDDLFQEVSALVGELDQAYSEVMETTRVVTLKRANPQVVREAIAALVGQTARPSSPAPAGARAPAAPPTSARAAPSTGRPTPRPGMDAEGVRRRVEFFRALQQGLRAPAPSPARGQNARPVRRSGGSR